MEIEKMGFTIKVKRAFIKKKSEMGQTQTPKICIYKSVVKNKKL
jgi:hypothetical protein